jgi:hypothetical protein
VEDDDLVANKSKFEEISRQFSLDHKEKESIGNLGLRNSHGIGSGDAIAIGYLGTADMIKK